MAASTTVQDIGSGRIIVADQVNPSLQIVYDPTLGTWHTVKSDSGKVSTSNYVWDTGSLAWVKMTQPTGGGCWWWKCCSRLNRLNSVSEWMQQLLELLVKLKKNLLKRP